MPVAVIIDDTIAEIFPSRESLTGRYHPDFVDALVDVPENVRPGWIDVDGSWHERRPVLPLTVDDYSIAIEGYVDAKARARGYADGVSLAGYASSTIPQWAAEAAQFIAWRDKVWMHAFGELTKVQKSQRQAPELASLIGELPAIGW